MSRTAKRPKVAELQEQDLPTDAREANLPSASSGSLAHPAPRETVKSPAPDAFLTAGDGSPKLSSESATVKEAAPNRVDAHERLFQLVQSQAQYAREAKLDRVAVILRPDAQTEIVLQLRVQNGHLEAHARCDRGDFGALNSGWNELQRSLLDCGVRLAPLVSGLETTRDRTGENAFGSGGSPDQQKQPPPQAERGPREWPESGRPSRGGAPRPSPRLPLNSSRLLEQWA